MGHRAAVNLLVKRTDHSLGHNRAALFTPLLDLQKFLNYTAEHWTSTTKSSAVYTTILSYKLHLFLHNLHTSPPTTVIGLKCIKGRCMMFRTFSAVTTIIATKITDYQKTHGQSIHFIQEEGIENNMTTSNTSNRRLFASDYQKMNAQGFYSC